MTKLLERRLPLSQLLWRAETEGKDLSTPERRAGLEQRLKEIVDRRSPTARSPTITAAASRSGS